MRLFVGFYYFRSWLTLSVLCVFCAEAIAHDPALPVTFRSILASDGLSNNTVRDVLQDDYGYIWIGTNEGLNRYDGLTFSVFRNDPVDPQSLSSNLIIDLLMDSNGRLWVGTDDGLNRMEDNGRFHRYDFSSIHPEHTGTDFILTLMEDSKGRIWIGSVNGLHVYQPETNSFKSYFHDPDDPWSLSRSHINGILEDHEGEIWITTHGKGINRFISENETFERIVADDLNDLDPAIPWTPTCIVQDSQQRIWVGTWDRGLFRFFPQSREFRPVPQTEFFNIRKIFEDRDGNIWVATLGQGILFIEADTDQMFFYKHDSVVDTSLTGNYVHSIMQDKTGLYWVGVEGGGVNTFRFPRYQAQHFQPTSIHETTLQDARVSALLEDRQGQVWIGTQEAGLHRFDPQSGEYRTYIYAREDNRPTDDTVVINYVYSLRLLPNDQLLVGSMGYGLLVFDPRSETFRTFFQEETLPYIGYYQTIKDIEHHPDGNYWVCNDEGRVIELNKELEIVRVFGGDENPFSFKRFTSLEFMDETHLWIGTEAGGLNLLDIESGDIHVYTHDVNDSNTLSNNSIHDLLVDSQGRLWAATRSGLNRYHPQTDSFEQIEAIRGHPSETIMGMLEDSSGSLWLSTKRGLIRYDPEADKARWYGPHNGVQPNEFGLHSCYAGAKGTLYFGGLSGWNRIQIPTFRDYDTDAPLSLNSIRVNGSRYSFDQDLNSLNAIELSYNNNNLALQYALLDYADPEKNRLEYRLTPDEQWQSMNESYEIIFADLSPGERNLQVRGWNADGFLSSETEEFTVLILPPFWLTWWFAMLCSLTAIAFAVILYRHRVRQIANQNYLLQKKVDEQIAQLKILDGLLPICSYCKKVRDDKGYWSQVEAYVQARSQAKFSHGICPDCSEKHFPEFNRTDSQ